MNTSDIKILLVDDEPDILEIVGYNLKSEGYQVFTANNGAEGFKTAKKVIPHLILLDIMMPEMDGIEACEKIRKDKSLENVLISFLTARGEDYSQVAGFDAGADDYITKLFKGETKITLPRKEFELFSLLTSKPGKVFKREVILDNVWGNEVVVGGRTIDVHIRKLREKIGDHYFKTVKGVGYIIYYYSCTFLSVFF